MINLISELSTKDFTINCSNDRYLQLTKLLFIVKVAQMTEQSCTASSTSSFPTPQTQRLNSSTTKGTSIHGKSNEKSTNAERQFPIPQKSENIIS